ncbi:MAG: AMP-binding protein [Rickettsiales bacterium]|nr:AMP-binding protein [Rickettsiales bacterium]
MSLSNNQDCYYLSQQQLRIWWAEQVSTNSSLNVPLRFDIEGNLNIEVLSNSIKDIVVNYEILNSKLLIKDQEILQDFSGNSDFAIEIINLEGSSDKVVEDEIAHIASTRYDLSCGLPLVRVYLIRKKTDSFVLLILTHHIILDGISCINLVSLINETYNKKLISTEYSLSAPTYNYSHYITNKTVDDNAIKLDTEFWLNHFRDTSISNIFQTNNFGVNDSPINTFVNLDLSESDFIKIQKLSSKSKVTPFIFFLGIYLLLIHKITAEKHILIATPVSKRDNEDLQKLIGLIADIVPYSFSVNRAISFKEFLTSVKKQFFTLLNHSELPIERIYDKLKEKNALGLSDYYKLMIVFNDYSNLVLKLDDTSSTFVDTFCGARAGLLLAITVKDKKVSIRFEYETEYFCHDYVKNFADLYNYLITQVLSNEGALLKDYNIILPEEGHALHKFENGMQVCFGTDKGIINIFDELVSSNPERIVLITEDNKYTISDLQAKSYHIELFLKERLIKPGDVIGVMFERSVEVYASLLGILRAGCIYMPIPDLPLQRINYMFEQAHPKLILSKKSARHFWSIQGCEVIDIEDIYANNKINIRQDQKKDIIAFTPNCYVLFTSGSTGKPKAVLGSQRGLLNRLHWAWRQFPFITDDVCCHITSIGFIDSLTEMLTPLLSGAIQVIVSDTISNKSDEFVSNLVLHNITRLTTVPALLRFFSDAFAHYSKKLSHLRLIISSGEEIDHSLASKYTKILPYVKIVNLYGSTEVNGDATFYEINRSKLDNNKYIPIGRPIDNSSVYILNKHNEKMPILFTGEIAVGGVAVNDGYLDEDLNSKFVHNPFDEGFMYKTGDYGYYLRDGNIRFIGRESGLVKIFGHRVSIKEIKRVILDITEVIDVYIKYSADNNFDVLTAYLQVNTQTFFDLHESYEVACLHIRTELSQLLPFYMIPSEYVFLDHFPRLYNGKLDVQYLVSNNNLNVNKKTSSLDNLSYRDIIINTWKNILGKPEVDLDANFFDLGGNSLLLVQAYKELTRDLPKIIAAKLKIIDLFTYHSINKLSEYCHFLDYKPSNVQLKPSNSANDRKFSDDIAVIGFACRFPGAKNHNEFWENLKLGTESIKFLDSHNDDSKVISKKILASAQLDCTEHFDHEFFGYTEAEAKLMDPQHRILLEECYKALENSGYSAELYNGKIGIFVGASDSKYFINNILLNNKLCSTSSFDVGFWSASQLNSTQFLSTKIAYKLNCTGPALNITTACSTSLVAIGMAAQHLRSNACDIILAGGVSLILPDDELFEYQKGSILSRDGHCRPFSSDSDGTLIGSGVGVVVLKRLQAAIKDNDSIYAVIKGIGINNDGSNKVSYSAPSVEGQEKCIVSALSDAQISPETITYVESHGTGTKLGDPVEFTALTKAFAISDNIKNYCAIGSVKANIGHANIAAGVASFIKVILCLYHKQLVPLINFSTINPDIDILNSPFYINTNLVKWDRYDRAIPLRASVNSLGIGGTNAHIILEEWPENIDEIDISNSKHNILCFSAKSKAVLKEIIAQFLDFLLKRNIYNKKSSITDIAFTLAEGRQSFEHRTGFICKNVEDAIESLEAFDENMISHVSKPIYCAFILSNNDIPSWFTDKLYNEQKLYKKIVDECRTVIENRFNSINNKDSSKEKLLSLSSKYSLLKFLILIGLKPKFTLYDSASEILLKCIYEDIQFYTLLDKEGESNFYTSLEFQADNLSSIIQDLRTKNTNEPLIFLDIFSLFNEKDLSQDILQICDRNESNNSLFYTSLLHLWVAGISISLGKLSSSNHRVALPSYPFQKIKHWIKREKTNAQQSQLTDTERSIEDKVLNIWREVFENNYITITDEFYALGGHSLIALQIASRITEIFSFDIDSSIILRGIDVKGLCKVINQDYKHQTLEQDNKSSDIDINPYPLSCAERRMWLLDNVYPKSGICNIPVALRLDSKIDIKNLTHAIACLVQKHELLRTYFVFDGNNVLHNMHQDLKVNVESMHCTSDDDLQNTLQQLVKTNFDLTKGPLFHVILINEPLNTQTIFFIFHHIIMDAWSFRIFMEDLNSFYTSLSRREVIQPVALVTGYRDFVHKQKEALQYNKLASQKRYWATKLTNFNYNQNIFYNISSDKLKSHDAKNYLITLDEASTSLILMFAKQNDVTLFVVLLSVYKFLVSLYSGSDDVAVVAPFANRKQKSLENIIGLFTNFVILRSNLSKANNFYQLIHIVQDVILEAHNNSDVPFEEVLQNNEIDISFLWMFIMHEAKIQNNEIFGCNIAEKFNLHPPTSQSPLSLEVKVQSNNLVLNFIYSEYLMEQTLVERVAYQYVETVTQLIQYPGNNLSQHFLPKEKDVQFYDEDLSYPLDQDLYSLFYKKLYQNPYKIAIIDYLGKTYNYLYLAQRVETIACSINTIGVMEGMIIGVCIDHSLDLIACILSILKLGCIYLPLDNSYPHKRLQYYIDDSGADYILTTSSIQIVQSLKVKNLIYVDQLNTSTVAKLQDISPIKVNNKIASIIYTSGSTGNPKGVMIKHISIINRCYWFQSASEIGKKEIFCLSTSINFVDSIAEIFTPLILGYELYIPLKQSIMRLDDFLHDIREHKVTHLVVVPSLLKLILENENAKFYLENLSRIICSGDVLTLHIAQKCLDLGLKLKLYNYYGSTEVTADSTFYEVTQKSIQYNQLIPIGHEISNTKVVILNNNLEIVPHSISGFIYVTGFCLAEGYWRDPKQTNEKFISLKYNNRNYTLFNTGDIGFRSKNGEIFYLGRKDSVININGYKINLLEIEHIIKEALYVQDAVVQNIIKHDLSILIAFIVLSPDISRSSYQNIKLQLIHHLSQFLPKYMMPNMYKFVENIPLTLNGKIDRNKLKELHYIETDIDDDQIFKPQNEVEQFIYDQFLKLLNVTKAKLSDNFLYLGGTSILLIKLIGILERNFNTNIEIANIFNDATLNNILIMVQSNKKKSDIPEFVFKISDDIFYDQTIILFPPISGFSHVYLTLKDWLLGYNVYCINYPYLVGDDLGFNSIESMAEYYISKMLNVIKKTKKVTLVGYSFGGIVTVEASKYLLINNIKIDQLIMIDSYFPTEIIKKKSIINYEIKKSLQNIEFDYQGLTRAKVVETINKNYTFLLNYKIPKLNRHVYLLKTALYPENHIKLWEQGISSNLITIDIPGEHFTLMEKPHAHIVGRRIKEILNQKINSEVLV